MRLIAKIETAIGLVAAMVLLWAITHWRFEDSSWFRDHLHDINGDGRHS